ncbi:hypothetical protein H9P43_009761 [Blastocladiella emersonii ATCC 22665]|nr:hypothetical protein H9P43_009761 [Blastocladiella emersonii ATCC 22665]
MPFTTETSNYKESVYLMAVGQNVAVSSCVIAPFALFDFGSAVLDAFYIKHAMVLYAVLFTFVALAGRLTFAVYATGKASKSAMATLKLVDGKLDNGATASFVAGAADSGNGFKVDVHETSGKIKHIGGKYPVKRGGGLLSTWKLHYVNLYMNEGQLTIVPIDDAEDLGVSVKLGQAQLDTNPGQTTNCIAVAAGGREYWLQFPSDREVEKWTSLMTTLVITRLKKERRGLSIPADAVNRATSARGGRERSTSYSDSESTSATGTGSMLQQQQQQTSSSRARGESVKAPLV